jgi:hypothetical protein
MSSTRFLARRAAQKPQDTEIVRPSDRRAGAEVMKDPNCADMPLAARKARRWLGNEGAPRSLEDAIANLEAITSCILETQGALEDAQCRLQQQLAAVADDIEERWQVLEQQVTAAVALYD